jgi:hypothetical protein
MPHPISAVRGGSAFALAAALLAGSMSVPASAPATPAPRQQAAPLQCNPSSDRCFPVYAWYSDHTYSTVVGNGVGDCNGGIEVTSGYQTPHGAIIGWGFCPD